MGGAGRFVGFTKVAGAVLTGLGVMANFPPVFTYISANLFLKHHPDVSRDAAEKAWYELNKAGVPAGRMYEALDAYFSPPTVTLTPLERKFAKEIGCDEISYARGKVERDKDKDEIRDIHKLVTTEDKSYDSAGRPIGRTRY
jgi:hypothetical protein